MLRKRGEKDQGRGITIEEGREGGGGRAGGGGGMLCYLYP